MESGKELFSFPKKYISSDTISLTIGPDDEFMAMGLRYGRIIIWLPKVLGYTIQEKTRSYNNMLKAMSEILTLILNTQHKILPNRNIWPNLDL